MMPSYYAYGDVNPSALNNPSTGYWENVADWQRVYQHTPAYAYHYYQGIHDPAPVYYSNQSTAPAATYYYNQPPGAPHLPGYYYQPPAPTGTWPYNSPPPSSYTCHPLTTPSPYYSSQQPFSNYCQCYPTAQYPQQFQLNAPIYGPYASHCPSAQAAAQLVLSANAALAQQPSAPYMYVGKTQAEIDMQNAILAAQYQAMGMVPASFNGGMPQQIVPYKPAANGAQQFWCKEMDGSWTLRDASDMMGGTLNPGHWERHATSGYYYWVRQST